MVQATRPRSNPELVVGGNVDGLSMANNGAFGQVLAPPDDCVAFNGASNYGIQGVNLVVGGFDAGGLGAFLDLNDFFVDTESLSDPSCFYDVIAGNWVFTVLAFNSNGTESHMDVELVFDQGAGNKNNWLTLPFQIFRFDTTNPAGNSDCPCLPDQPFIAMTDGGTLWISDNEFGPLAGCISGGACFLNGADTYWITNLYVAPTVNGIFNWFGSNIPDVCNPGGDSGPVSTFRPMQAAVPDPNPRELFLTAWDPQGCGGNVIAALAIDTLGNVSSAFPQGQNFFVPPSAQQMGSGFVLQNNDDRLERVTLDSAGFVYSTLASAVNLGEAVNRSGEAGWRLLPTWAGTTLTGLTIINQNLVGILGPSGQGQYMLFMAMGVPDVGPNTDESLGTLSGSDFFPSTLAVEGLLGSCCNLSLPGAGVAPYSDSFTCPVAPGCRWGDYSGVAVVPGTPTIWFGGEYVSGASFAGVNWATRVSQIQP